MYTSHFVTFQHSLLQLKHTCLAFLQCPDSVAELLILLFQSAICRADNVFSVKIAHSHGGSGPQSHTWFLWPSRVHTVNSISIGLVVFVRLIIAADRQTDTPGYSNSKGSDTLESCLSKVAFESNLRKKLARLEHVLIVKVYFERRKICESFHDTRARFLSKVTFESNFRKKTF